MHLSTQVTVNAGFKVSWLQWYTLAVWQYSDEEYRVQAEQLHAISLDVIYTRHTTCTCQ